jgi:hypothetical protein
MTKRKPKFLSSVQGLVAQWSDSGPSKLPTCPLSLIFSCRAPLHRPRNSPRSQPSISPLNYPPPSSHNAHRAFWTWRYSFVRLSVAHRSSTCVINSLSRLDFSSTRASIFVIKLRLHEHVPSLIGTNVRFGHMLRNTEMLVPLF